MGIVLPDWKLYSLEMDEGGMEIGEHFESTGYPITRVNPGEKLLDIGGFIPAVQKSADKGLVAKAVSGCIETDSKVLALYGHGGYHFFTYGLAMLANRLSPEFGYIHIDHHDDSWFRSLDEISCGAFVQQLCNDTHVYGAYSRMLYIGNDGGKKHGSQRGDFVTEEMLLKCPSIEENLGSLSVDDVYVTIDLDVVDKADVLTSFDRGSMRSERLKDIVRQIKKHKNIISADIVGYSKSLLPWNAYCRANNNQQARVNYKKPRKKSMKLYKELADIITGAENGK